MARVGQFSGGTEGYGRALSFVHPTDNDFEKGRYDPALLALHLAPSDLEDLQSRVQDLYRSLQGDREWF